jgi:hypothetical protein
MNKMTTEGWGKRLASMDKRPCYEVDPTYGVTTEMTLHRRGATGVDYELEVTVCGYAQPYVPARTNGDPDDCYPSEGGYAEDITAFVYRHGMMTPIDLTRDEEEAASERITDCVDDRGRYW